MEKTYRTLTNLIHHLASFTDDNKSDIHDNLRDCKFRNIVWFEIFANKFKTKSSYLLHLDICSYQKNFEYFSIPLKKLNKNFDVIGITEPKVKSNQFVQEMLFCLTFFIELPPTEISAAEALLYITQRYFYRPRTDLNI